MIFCMKIKSKDFYKLVASFLLVRAGHAQSTQNTMFIISLQYPENEGRAEVDFLHVDKHQTILQIDRINLGGYDQAGPQIIQNCNFVNSLEYLKKEAKDEVDFVCR